MGRSGSRSARRRRPRPADARSGAAAHAAPRRGAASPRGRAATLPTRGRTSRGRPVAYPRRHHSRRRRRAPLGRWGTGFDADRLATLETRMWKAYYRRQPARLFGWLLLGLREQAGAAWPTALAASVYLTRAAAGFARTPQGAGRGDYNRFAQDIGRAYRLLGLPDDVDADEVARRELRWWVVRREIGLAAGSAAGDAITSLYAAIYAV